MNNIAAMPVMITMNVSNEPRLTRRYGFSRVYRRETGYSDVQGMMVSCPSRLETTYLVCSTRRGEFLMQPS